MKEPLLLSPIRDSSMIESHQTQMVILVDRDPLVRTQLSAAINERQWSTSEFESVETCTSAIEMLSSDLTLCVVSELSLPGRGGLGLQDRLNAMPKPISTIFYTEQASTNDIVTAMNQGALTVIEKSEGHHVVLHRLDEAFELARRNFETAEQQRIARDQLRSLSRGETEVLEGILNGKLNKEIAQQLNLSVRTIEQRRRQIFNKLDVQHPASLAQKVIHATHLLNKQPAPIELNISLPMISTESVL